MNDKLKGLSNIIRDLRAQALEVAKQIERLDHRLQPRYLQEEVKALTGPFFKGFEAVTGRAVWELMDRAHHAQQALEDAKQPPQGEFPFARRREIRDRLIAMPSKQRSRFIVSATEPDVFHALSEHVGERLCSESDLETLARSVFRRETEEMNRCYDDVSEAKQLVNEAEQEIDRLFNNSIPTDGRG